MSVGVIPKNDVGTWRLGRECTRSYVAIEGAFRNLNGINSTMIGRGRIVTRSVTGLECRRGGDGNRTRE